jgi:hypothetical protein
VREARGALRATSLQYLDVALNTPCERPWHWVYVPDPRLSFYRVGCYTTFSAALAPTGKGSLYVELAQREPVELGDILPRVADELVELGLIRAREAIRFARLRNDLPRVRDLRRRASPRPRRHPALPRAGGDRLGGEVRRVGVRLDGGRAARGSRGRTARGCGGGDVSAPRLSFVIPIHDEEPILTAAVLELRENAAALGVSYEIVLAENGSTDKTLRVADKLSARFPEVRYFSLPEPNYGAALREGIERARGELVICEEIDLCDADFHKRALELLEGGGAELVIGSKLLEGAEDVRPRTRHAASLLYSAMLRVTLGFQGTDTHGLKAMRKEALLPIVRACLVDKDVFASELVLRAQRAGLRVLEIPVRVLEKRVPSINLVSRVPGVVSRVARLWWALRKD